MRIIFFSILLSIVIFAQATEAGTAKNKNKDKELFDQGAELSYEGQLKMAEQLAGKGLSAPKTSAEDDWSGTSIFLAMIWGAIGTGYFIYGKKQARYVFLLCGIGLMVFPYFVSDMVASIVVGLILLFTPFKVEL
ncbi:MAG: hypothetical protein PHD82_08300 [Candidatus Riflebacteria bacterium]|nr:hypothetical protein [Candidatus Riflebacteria bacterium]